MTQNLFNPLTKVKQSHGFFREWRSDNGRHRVGVMVAEAIPGDSENIRVTMRFAFYKTKKNNHYKSLLAKAVNDMNSDDHSIVIDRDIRFEALVAAYGIHHLFDQYLEGFMNPSNVHNHDNVVRGVISELYPRGKSQDTDTVKTCQCACACAAG